MASPLPFLGVSSLNWPPRRDPTGGVFFGAPLRQAKPLADVKSSIIAGRRLPCICPPRDTDQGRPAPAPGRGVTVAFSEGRGVLVEQVKCDTCWRTWVRVNPKE